MFTGAVSIDGTVVQPGHLAYLGLDRDECSLSTIEPSRALLVGGQPFVESISMWWNFVARDNSEVSEAYRAWANGDERFGPVRSPFGTP